MKMLLTSERLGTRNYSASPCPSSAEVLPRAQGAEPQLFPSYAEQYNASVACRQVKHFSLDVTNPEKWV